MYNPKSFKGLYGDDSIILVRNLINIVRIEEKSKYYNWQIKQHLHPDLFQIFLIETGSLDIIFEDEKRHVESKSLFTIPKNVLHGFNMTPNLTGWTITLSDSFLEDMLKLDANIVFAIDEVSITKIDLHNPFIAEAYATIKKCIDEFYNNLPGKHLSLQYLAGMLILRLYRIPASSQEIIKFTENSNKIYFRRFTQLLKESESLKKTVEGFASELSISASHLNRICKSVSGSSTKEIIVDYSIFEAKKALANFELSIAEIAYNLNFKDPAYFSRLFKKRTGFTPKAYREQQILQ